MTSPTSELTVAPDDAALREPVAPDEAAHCLARCALGDRDALARLYQLSAPRLFGIATRIVGRRDLAEEILQDGFLRIWSHAAEYRPERGTAFVWMTSIIRHRALDLLRRTRPQVDIDDIDAVVFSDADGPEAQALVSQDARRLRACLETLAVEQRQGITAAFYHGLTHAELARHFALPLGTVKGWVRRGLQQLRRCLES